MITDVHATRSRLRARLLASLAVSGLLLAGCGDDSGGATEDADAVSASAYCDQVEVLESQDSEPTEEQLAALEQAAPEEIRADVERFNDAIRSHDMEAEGVAEAEERILAWEEENCA